MTLQSEFDRMHESTPFCECRYIMCARCFPIWKLKVGENRLAGPSQKWLLLDEALLGASYDLNGGRPSAGRVANTEWYMQIR